MYLNIFLKLIVFILKAYYINILNINFKCYFLIVYNVYNTYTNSHIVNFNNY